MQGMKTSPPPSPTHIPCESTSCQYVLAKLALNIPNSWRKVPIARHWWKYPASPPRPEKAERKKSRKASMEPIHDISDGVF